ncbi:hypothetical protein PBI_SCTP2_268 [Salicola phage SCTP-2]|nr:hypothetical protein PBI_SCTP2_268 [Salicola phage SCTP-2]
MEYYRLITYNHDDVEFYNNIEFIDEFIEITKNSMVIYDPESWNCTPANMKRNTKNVIVISPHCVTSEDDLKDVDIIDHVIIMPNDSFVFIENKINYIFNNENNLESIFIFGYSYLKHLFSFHIHRVYLISNERTCNSDFNILKISLLDTYYSFKNVLSYSLNSDTKLTMYDSMS